MKKLSERELGKCTVEVLRRLGFETWQEVMMSKEHFTSTPFCDIIGKYNNEYYAFELKTSLNDKVLFQAKKLSHLVHYTYVVVPFKKRGSVSEVKKFYIRENGLGLAFLDINRANKKMDKITSNNWFNDYMLFNFFRMPIKPSFNKYVKEIEDFLYNEQKESVAGSKCSDRTTPFKRSCVLIYNYLQENPEAKRKEVWNKLKDKLHWSSYNSMTSSFKSFKHLEIMKKIKWKV